MFALKAIAHVHSAVHAMLTSSCDGVLARAEEDRCEKRSSYEQLHGDTHALKNAIVCSAWTGSETAGTALATYFALMVALTPKTDIALYT